jgi:hypothetical protein
MMEPALRSSFHVVWRSKLNFYILMVSRCCVGAVITTLLYGSQRLLHAQAQAPRQKVRIIGTAIIS